MWPLIKGIWTDEERGKRFGRAILLSMALAITTGAGAEIFNGDIANVTASQWIRLAATVILGLVGGSLSATQTPGTSATARIAALEKATLDKIAAVERKHEAQVAALRPVQAKEAAKAAAAVPPKPSLEIDPEDMPGRYGS